jgi:polyribonucleotide nucleotidyltransferase
MATVCGASLALMDAGVPIKAPAAGVSIGLITKCDESTGNVSEYRLITDILGTEDHFGDMDFKVAGTNAGVTAIQLDVKLPRGVPLEILCEALDCAREGRAQILNEMNKSLPRHRAKPKATAPSAQIVKFDPERKRFLLGFGNETVNHIQESFSCEIDASTPGVAYIFGMNPHLVQQARDLVQDLLVPIKEGDIAQAEVIEVRDFGVFVRVSRAQEALLHVSELTYDTTLLKKPLVELLKVGQRFTVKVCMNI